MKEKILQLPLSEETVRELNIGDIVYFNGILFTGRELFYIRAVEENIIPTIDFNLINLMFHVGPVVKKVDREWKIVSMTPTTSIRFEKNASVCIKKLHTRAIIGKGTMGTKTMKMMQREGCVHLCGVGINANVLATQVEKVLNVFYLDKIGPTEATWVMKVNNFGPFLVDIDSKGNNYFDTVNQKAKKKLKEILNNNGINENFEYTPIHN